MRWEGVGAARDLGTGPAVPTAKPCAGTPCSPVSSARLSGEFNRGGEEEQRWLRGWGRVSSVSRVWSVRWSFLTACPGAPGGQGCWSVTAPVPTNTLQASACSHPPTVLPVHLGWSWHILIFRLFYFVGHFWETMYFLSSEFVLVCTGNCREAYFFFMVIGSRCEPFAFTPETLSGVCAAVSVVCLK